MSGANYPETDPRHHTERIKRMLSDVSNHMRADIGKIEDPRAQALFETSAEVLNGLIKAYNDYENKAEQAWRQTAGR